jgi:hypothetical protein
VLANHTSVLDPLWISLITRRRVRFMAGTRALRIPFVGWYLRQAGTFPSKRSGEDRRFLRTLLTLYELGEVLVLFPESQQSWDGRSSPIRPEVGTVLRRMRPRVVFLRNLTGHLRRPRWAEKTRSVPVEIECNEPMLFSNDMNEQLIVAEVHRRIRIPQPSELRGYARGRKLARGLPRYLWACPACFSEEALEVERDPDCVGCGACDSRWRLDVLGQMRALGEGGQDMSVAEAADAIYRHLGQRPVFPGRREEAPLLSAPQAVLKQLGEEGLEILVEGPASLTRETLSVESWSRPLRALGRVTVDSNNRLRMHCEGEWLVLDPRGDSAAKWAYFLRGWA